MLLGVSYMIPKDTYSFHTYIGCGSLIKDTLSVENKFKMLLGCSLYNDN